MKSIKNEYIELPVYASLGALKLFKDKFGKSLEVYMADPNAERMEAFAFLVYNWHLSASKKLRQEPKVANVDDLLDLLTLEDISQIVEIMGGAKSIDANSEGEQKKIVE